MQTRLLGTDDCSISDAVRILDRGGLVAFPTETVYGLGADARNDAALAKIFKAKGRPSSNPLIVHVSNIEAATKIVEFDDLAMAAAAAFWPGPLTLLLREREDSGISSLAAAKQPLLGVRIPSHPVALRLLAEFGNPVAAPSANRSNKVSPTQVEHVIADLDGKIKAVIDGGKCTNGLESTILMSFAGKLALMRLGAITDSEIRNALGIAPEKTTNQPKLRTPGEHTLHYAPTSDLRIEAIEASNSEVTIGFGPVWETADFNLSSTSDIVEAAFNLYAILRKADELAQATGRSKIAVAKVPKTGIGKSINDRLQRASGRLTAC